MTRAQTLRTPDRVARSAIARSVWPKPDLVRASIAADADAAGIGSSSGSNSSAGNSAGSAPRVGLVADPDRMRTRPEFLLLVQRGDGIAGEGNRVSARGCGQE